MKKTPRFLAAGMALMLTLTGCSNADVSDIFTSGQDANSSQVTGTDIKNYGAAVTVADIKKARAYDDSKEIMPLYNVEQTEKFTFEFKFDSYEADVELYDFVTVHTDAKCGEKSSIYYTANLDVKDGVSTLTVSPMSSVLGTDSQIGDAIHNDTPTWGNAPIYYLAIHYDMEADSPVKLEKPVIIPFTVKHDSTAPTVRGVVDANGLFTLEWDAVEGAEKYIVYNLFDRKVSTGVDNHPINGSETGYDLGISTDEENNDALHLIKDGETEKCVYFDDNIVEISDVTTGKPITFGQNYNVYGEYYVTAVVNGKESGLSNPVETTGLKIPYKATEENEIKSRYPTPADFPSEVEILNIDGSSTTRKVTYERVKVDYYEFHWEEYDYVIEGTHFRGHVGFENDIGEPQKPTGTSVDTGNAAPENKVDKTPDKDVQTIIPADEDDYKDKPIIDAQADNTKKHIENGNRAEVKNLPEGVYINAETAEEEWLALNLVQGNTEISVEGFTSLQNPYTLSDVFYKVYYQNPYILGIVSFSYDYNTMIFSVNYVYDKETITKKQTEISAKASEIVNSTITADMDTEQKINALYNYLVNNAVYDHEALAEAEKNNFQKSADSAYEDAFNTYGIIVGGKGVCMSYAYSFRLLCDLSDVKCIVTTGYLNGNLPHAWNMVSIDGKWYEIDCTNNAVNTGVPYYLYESDSSLAEKTGYTKDKMFTVDTDIAEFDGNDDSLEYYSKNGLSPENMEQYKKLITENVNESTEAFIVRWQGEINTDEFNSAVVLAFNELGLENKLEALRYSVTGGFLILIIENS